MKGGVAGAPAVFGAWLALRLPARPILAPPDAYISESGEGGRGPNSPVWTIQPGPRQRKRTIRRRAPHDSVRTSLPQNNLRDCLGKSCSRSLTFRHGLPQPARQAFPAGIPSSPGGRPAAVPSIGLSRRKGHHPGGPTTGWRDSCTTPCGFRSGLSSAPPHPPTRSGPRRSAAGRAGPSRPYGRLSVRGASRAPRPPGPSRAGGPATSGRWRRTSGPGRWSRSSESSPARPVCRRTPPAGGRSMR